MQEVALTPNSLMINGWLNIADVNATTYFFNLTNPEGVQFRGEKPSFKQVGPFGYVWVYITVVATATFVENVCAKETKTETFDCFLYISSKKRC